MIELKNINKSFCIGKEKIYALENVDLNINKQDFIAIIGPSGSGKSTLMNILGLLDVPDSGEYIFENKEISNLSDNELAEIRNKKIGFVFQNFNLLPKMNAIENIQVPLIYRGISDKESKEIAYKFLEKVGLNGKEKHLPSQLSGGQQQRVAIARAMAGNPDIILADEPTGALDSMSNVNSSFSLLLGGIASISLIVGGIGVMNVMLVSVTERTGEIGIRKSLGAKKKDILEQFLIEALILSIIGGFLGVFIGLGFGKFLEFFSYDFNPNAGIIVLSFFTSALIGLIFGIFPAYKAAKLNPIDALRTL